MTQYFIVRTTQPRPNKYHFSVLFIIITHLNREDKICKSKDANTLQFGMIRPEIFYFS